MRLNNKEGILFRLGLLVFIYVCFLIFFIIQKPLFMLFNISLYKGYVLMDWLRVIQHGIPLDLSISGYLTILPGLLLTITPLKSKWIASILNVYFFLVLLIISVLFITDSILYSYWGFHVDTGLFFYLRSPKEAAASASNLQIILAFLSAIVYFIVNYWLFRKIIIKVVKELLVPRNKIFAALVLLLATGMLFIPIRGGLSVSTMNIGHAYFSSDMLLNHAAVNVEMNFMLSAFKSDDFAKEYRFMDDNEAHSIFEKLKDNQASDSIPKVFGKSKDPVNVILVVLESFTSVVTASPEKQEIVPHLTQLGQEGIIFSNFYANSFRTDRGLVAITSGYPGQPNNSIMKYPKKSQSLPSIPKSLKKAGYDLEFYYGGDIDFTNMRSYFISCGIEKISSDKDYPVKDRLSKWGAPDHLLFSKLEESLKNTQKQPFFKMILTLSSHEPFEVPYQKLDDPFLNSVAYTDSCIGHFIDVLKNTPYWENTVVILIPDHAAYYPETLSNYEPRRYHIPMVWAGGALVRNDTVTQCGSQIDLPATLLYQLGLPFDDFEFSKNMFNPASPKFAFYAFKDGFGYVTEEDTVVYDNESGKELIHCGKNPGEDLIKGKAFLQFLYDDLSKR